MSQRPPRKNRNLSRYQAASLKSEDVGQVYETQLVPNVSRQPEDTIITTESGQRLDRLASEYYGDPTLWWVIASANELGRGDWTVPAGIQLRIPQNLSNVSNEIDSINRVR
jgi:nucleoid-associated protein YgaU